MTVGKLPPVLDDWHVAALRRLAEDFAGFYTSRVNRQLEYLLLLRARHSGGQITGAIKHGWTSKG